MIVYQIVNLLLDFLRVLIFPITLLPDVTLDPQLAVNLTSAGAKFAMVYGIAPYTMTALIAVFIIFLGIEAAILAYKIIKWIYSKIPGIT